METIKQLAYTLMGCAAIVWLFSLSYFLIMIRREERKKR